MENLIKEYEKRILEYRPNNGLVLNPTKLEVKLSLKIRLLRQLIDIEKRMNVNDFFEFIERESSAIADRLVIAKHLKKNLKKAAYEELESELNIKTLKLSFSVLTQCEGILKRRRNQRH